MNTVVFETVHMIFAERLLVRAVFPRSLKVFGWQLGTAKFRDHDFRKKKTYWLFRIHRTSDNYMGTVAP